MKLVKKSIVRPVAKPLIEGVEKRSDVQARELSDWNKRVADGMNRMSVDEQYRLDISKRLS